MVFRVKSSRGRRLALKRMAVNNDNDLYLARQEIAIMVRPNSSCIEGSFLSGPIPSFSKLHRSWEMGPGDKARFERISLVEEGLYSVDVYIHC